MKGRGELLRVVKADPIDIEEFMSQETWYEKHSKTPVRKFLLDVYLKIIRTRYRYFRPAWLEVKYAVQRAFRGHDDRLYYSTIEYVLPLLIEGLDFLMKEGHTKKHGKIDDNPDTSLEDWHEMLKEMQKGFAILLKENKEYNWMIEYGKVAPKVAYGYEEFCEMQYPPITKSFELLLKYHNYLWDFTYGCKDK